MIDTDETGQKKWDELIAAAHTGPWSKWDFRFIWDNKGNKYSQLSPKQKTTVGTLHEKLVRV